MTSPRCSPTSCCRPPPGTRSTTCPRPTCTRSCTRSPRPSTRRGRPGPTSTPSRPSPGGSASWPRDHLGVAPRPGRARRCSTTRPGEMAQPGGLVRDWGAGECEPVPGRTMPGLSMVERDYAAIADKLAALGPLVETARPDHQGRHCRPRPRGRRARPQQRRAAGGPAAGRPALDTDAEHGRGDPGAVRHHQRPPRRAGLPPLEERTGRQLADLAEARGASGSPSPTPRRGRCRSSPRPEWSGIGDRRPAVRAVHRSTSSGSSPGTR